MILLQKIRLFLFRHLAGYHLGKKMPFLWKIYNFLFCLSAPKKFIHTLNGIKFLIDLKEPVYHFRNILITYSSLKTYEPNTLKVIKQHLKKDDVVLDVGASLGPLSIPMSKWVWCGKVYAIEPTPACFYYLCANIELNKRKNIFPYQVAAWDKHEIVKVQTRTSRPYFANGVILDDFLESLGVYKVDFIKIDIDGHEPKALQGLQRTIRRNPRLKMVIEYYPQYLKDAGHSPLEVLQFLNKYFIYEAIDVDYGEGCWNLFCQRKP